MIVNHEVTFGTMPDGSIHTEIMVEDESDPMRGPYRAVTCSTRPAGGKDVRVTIKLFHDGNVYKAAARKTVHPREDMWYLALGLALREMVIDPERALRDKANDWEWHLIGEADALPQPELEPLE